MKRAMGANHTQKHDYLLASSMWPLKNKLKHMKDLLSFLVFIFFATIVAANSFNASNAKNILLKGTGCNVEIKNTGNALWKLDLLYCDVTHTET